MRRRTLRALAIALAAMLSLAGLAYADNHEPTETDDPAVVDETQDEGTEGQEGDVDTSEDTEDATDDTETADDPEAVDDTEVEASDEPTDVIDGVERSTDGCPDGTTYRNHGEYVSSTQERPRNEAATSNCGKPVHAVNGDASADEVEPSDTDGDSSAPGSRGKGKGPNK